MKNMDKQPEPTSPSERSAGSTDSTDSTSSPQASSPQAQFEAAQARYVDLYSQAPVGYCTLSNEGMILEANLTAAGMLGIDRNMLLKQPITRFILIEDQDVYYLHTHHLFEVGVTGSTGSTSSPQASSPQASSPRASSPPQACELRMVKEDGDVFWVRMESSTSRDFEGTPTCRVVLIDITEHRLQEEALELTSRLIVLINTPGDFRQHMSELTSALQAWSACEAVGIRLHSGEDYPYYETRGFPAKFIQAENSLCAYSPDGNIVRDTTGNPILECMCGNILCGRVDPSKPFFTAHGSFWSNGTTSLLASTTDADRQTHTRNRCNTEGYESVALIPLHIGNQIFGLLQFNDHRPDRFSPDRITHMEKMADSLAIALSRRQAMEALRESEERFKLSMEATNDGLWDWNIRTNEGYFSPAYYRMLGYESDEFPQNVSVWTELIHPDDREQTLAANMACIEGGRDAFDIEYRMKAKSGDWHWILGRGKCVSRDEHGRAIRLVGTHVDITERKLAEEQLRESEAIVRNKLKAILEPKGDIGTLNLADIIDIEALRALMEDFYRLTKIGATILDISGKVLVAVGWQDICAKFHRCHPDTLKNCLESDVVLARGTPTGTFKAYKCKNNLWDTVTPIEVGGRHLGNIYIGQFFFEDEVPDYELFRRQARQYGFDETYYLAALDRAQRLSRESIDAAMAFYSKLAAMISSLSYSKIELSRALSQKEIVLRQLAESEERYTHTLIALDDGLWDWIVPSGKAFFSPTYYSMLGYEDGEFPACYESWRLLVHPDDIDRVEEVLRQSAESGKGFDIDLRMKMKSGQWQWVATRGKAIEKNAEGKAIRLVGTLTNISIRKQTEEENARLADQLQRAQKMESVGRLAGGVAHDFNNMLGVIMGRVEMALEKVGPGQPIHDFLEEIRKAGNRSVDLTRQLLAFARKQTATPIVIDLNEAVGGMLNMLQRLLGEGIHIEWRQDAKLWPIKMDPSQIDQILTNLCINARDAIPDFGTILLDAGNSSFNASDCANHEGLLPGEYVRLSVSDNGCGMNKETLSHIFEPFFTTKGVGKGTGLGLATVYGIVKQNNGFIEAYSELGKGSTFTIYLPKHVGNIERAPTAVSSGPAVRGHETLLLVEDEPAILEMARTLLEDQGYTVLAANTPSEAILLAREHAGEIHIFVTDVVMPEMNGRDLARSLQSLHPRIKSLFMSGYTADVIANHGVLDEGVHFIQKPFSIKGLSTKVREVLDSED